MSSREVSTYQASDGREFRVEWDRPENSQYRWLWNDAHNPEPMLPLAV